MSNFYAKYWFWWVFTFSDDDDRVKATFTFIESQSESILVLFQSSESRLLGVYEHWCDWSTDSPEIVLLNCNFTFYWEENLGKRIHFNLLYIGLTYIYHLLDSTYLIPNSIKPQSIIFSDQIKSGLQRNFFILICF